MCYAGEKVGASCRHELVAELSLHHGTMELALRAEIQMFVRGVIMSGRRERCLSRPCFVNSPICNLF